MAVTKEQVPERMGEKRTLLNYILCRKAIEGGNFFSEYD